MVFTKDSSLVKMWVANVKKGIYTLEQVPALFNLREVVAEVLESESVQ